MTKNITYRKVRDNDSEELFELVEMGFREFVEQDLTKEGTEDFFRVARQMIFERPSGHMIFVAQFDLELIGMIDVRNDGHICLFFVKKKYQKQGVGRGLLKLAESVCEIEENGNGKLSVNSSLFAVRCYENLGFMKTQSVQTVNGIKFVPMVRIRKNKAG